MKPIQLFDPASSTYTYVLFDEVSRDALIIDPVDDQLERDLTVLRDHVLKLVWTLETHTHADHITSAGLLAEHVGAKNVVPAGCGVPAAAVQLQDHEELRFGGERILALHTPGHTAGGMSYVWRDHVFTGDTLLINGCGRTDFQSGSAADLYRSITEVLFALPGGTTVWPGHDYQGRSSSSIAREKSGNARVSGKTLEEFTETMNNLDLPMPKRLHEAVPANQLSGLPVAAIASLKDASGAATRPLTAHVRPAEGYAGDVPPQLAFEWWKSGEAVLVDVRTDAEREWVGFIPGAIPLAWKQWPGMAMNLAFEEGLRATVPDGKKVVLLCRSGVRSVAAARCATALGMRAYNILEGFEGDPDSDAQRGHKGGWRFNGLPWRQG